MIAVEFDTFQEFKNEVLSRSADVRDLTIRLRVDRQKRFPYTTVAFVLTTIVAREDGDPDLLRLEHEIGTYTENDAGCEEMVAATEKAFTHTFEEAGFVVRDGEFAGSVAEGTQPGVGCTGP